MSSRFSLSKLNSAPVSCLGPVILSLLLFILGQAKPADADALYGATGNGTPVGTLILIDPTTGTSSTVGSLVDALGRPYEMTALAFHPSTGVLYGFTSQASPTFPRSFVAIDPVTAIVTFIGGPFTGVQSDLAFDADGDLYGSGRGRLHSIDLLTGQATPIGPNFSFGASTLAVDSAGTFFATTAGSTLDTLNPTTGAVTSITPMTPSPSLFHAIDFDASGTLFGVERRGTDLVTINTSTGVVTTIGGSLSTVDAIAFQPDINAVPEPSTIALLGFGLPALGLLRRRYRDR